jgi:hypothetical protein
MSDNAHPAVDSLSSCPRRRWKWWLVRSGWFLLLLPFAAWTVGVILFTDLPGAVVLCLLPPIIMLVPLFWLRSCRRALCIALAAFGLVVLGWSCLTPSNDRIWQPNVSQLASATVEGNVVTVHNVRNCDYRSETDYDVRHETRTYPLDGLRTVDLVMVNWGLKDIAHMMMSFGFEDGRYLCFSLETRMEVGEKYSAASGFFRNFELICIAGDERDLIGLRSNYREGENVSIYRLNPRDPDILRETFLAYLDRLNELHDTPEWYNALSENCMTGAYKIIRRNAANAHWDWRVILNEHVIEMAYEHGTVDTSFPIAEFRARSIINARAKKAGNSPDFSRLIRRGLPGLSDTANTPKAEDPSENSSRNPTRVLLAEFVSDTD